MLGRTLVSATSAATSSMRFSAMACTRSNANALRHQAFGAQRSSPLLRTAHTWALEASRPSPSSFHSSRPASISLRTSLLKNHTSAFSTTSRSLAPSTPHSSSSSTAAGAPVSRAAALTEEFQRHQRESYKRRNQSLFMYSAALMVFTLGFSYAAVPLYRAFCSATGFSGTPITDPERFAPSRLIPAYLDPTTNAPTKRIRVTFNADAADAIPWSFTPQQKEIYVLPGETVLAFYTAKNKSDKDIIGIATYNVSPDRIAPYFAKVECFCFEEQKLLAGEEVDFPVFFFIDSDVLDDPSTKGVDDVVLSYTFFSARRNSKNGQLEPDTDLSKYTVGKDL